MFDFKCHCGWKVIQVFEACGDCHYHGSWQCGRMRGPFLWLDSSNPSSYNYLTTHLDLVVRMYAQQFTNWRLSHLLSNPRLGQGQTVLWTLVEDWIYGSYNSVEKCQCGTFKNQKKKTYKVTLLHPLEKYPLIERKRARCPLSPFTR